jgi:acetolactate decarboxylase
MKRSALFLAILFALGCAHTPPQKDLVFQNAPINALLAGCYSGTMSIHDLKKHGDFGMGTLDALDGELIVLDGSFYQARSDGKVYEVPDSAKTPFAAVTFFKAEQTFPRGPVMDLQALKDFLDDELPSQNVPYAIKVEGQFETVKVRSPVRQQKPFRILTEAVKEQKTFELSAQEGTLIGFRMPPYMEGVNVPGYHFHFLNKEKTAGGHVLGFRLKNAKIEIDEADGFLMDLPKNKEFLDFHLANDAGEALAKVEK